MKPNSARGVAIAMLAGAVAGCTGGAAARPDTPPPAPASRPAVAPPTARPPATAQPPARPAADTAYNPYRPAPDRYGYTEADVHFMAGMIPHHAQAVVMGGWAASHGASSAVRILAERIVVAQRDEIEIMRTWLRDRGEDVPPADATHHRMTMGGMQHDMLMPGMLTEEEMAQLDRARGVEFDRLFLTFMIRHHEGALTMVDELFASNGGGQDELVFKMASDVWADQTTEIDRMSKMLEALPGGRTP